MGQIAGGLPLYSATLRTQARHTWDSGEPSRPSVNLDLARIMRRRAETVQDLQAFSDINLPDRIAIVASAQEKQYSRNFPVFAETEALDHVLLLVSRCLKVTQRGANDQEIILRLNGPGELLGEVGMQRQGGGSLTARAVQPSSALVWRASAFQEALDRFPTLRRNVSRGLEHKLDELDTRFREISDSIATKVPKPD